MLKHINDPTGALVGFLTGSVLTATLLTIILHLEHDIYDRTHQHYDQQHQQQQESP